MCGSMTAFGGGIAAAMALMLAAPTARATQLSVGDVGAEARIVAGDTLYGPVCTDTHNGPISASASSTGCGFPVGVAGLASADLRTGKLRLLTQDIVTHLSSGRNANTVSGGEAELADILTIDGPLTGRTAIGLSLTVHGSVSGIASTGSVLASLFAQNGPSYDRNAVALSGYDGNPSDAVSVLRTFNDGTISVSISSLTASDIQFTLTDLVDVDPTHRTIPFLARARRTDRGNHFRNHDRRFLPYGWACG